MLPSGATVVVNEAGTQLTFYPAFNFTGSDSFTYKVADEGGLVSDSATITVRVIDVVDITSATLRVRRNGSRWNIQGTGSDTTATVTLYLNSVLATNRIGETNIGIGGDWSFNGTSGVAGAAGDAVIAVSSAGGGDVYTLLPGDIR